MNHPVPSYAIAIAAGDIAFRSLGPRTGVWTEPAMLDRAAAELVDTERMVEAAEGLYGPYRWGRYDLLVLPPSFPYGGMENPTLTFLTPTFIAGDRSLNGLVAHELAHSWSGNLVTNAAWGDSWLNEGVTSYFENRIMEALYGRGAGGAGSGAELGRDAARHGRDRRGRERHAASPRRRRAGPGFVRHRRSLMTRALCSCGLWRRSSAASAGTPICAPISIATPSSR